MSTLPDRQNAANEPNEEPQPTDELTSESLDQVVGGGVEPSPWLGQNPQPGPVVNPGARPNLNNNAIIDDGRPAGS